MFCSVILFGTPIDPKTFSEPRNVCADLDKHDCFRHPVCERLEVFVTKIRTFVCLSFGKVCRPENCLLGNMGSLNNTEPGALFYEIYDRFFLKVPNIHETSIYLMQNH